jgi:hypothetical protein
VQCNAAGPAVERIWEDFRDTGVFAALAVDCWNGSIPDVQGFIAHTGISFPVLLDAGFLQASDAYDLAYDNYVLVDANGIVRYTSVNEIFVGTGRFDDAHLRAAIGRWLPVGVESRTWSSLKALYR